MSKPADNTDTAPEAVQTQETQKGDDTLAAIENLSPEALDALASKIAAAQAAKQGNEPDPAALERKERAEAEARETERMNEPVAIQLFKDNKDYKDDLFVGWNGKGYRIKRGVRVEVPRAVAEIVQQQLDQDNNTAQLISAQNEQYEADRHQYGV
ncbi:MAG: hypothetical protein VB058_05790 [Oscillospiraceae bacterium]|nr:hypothetical protein [Oscillospiraceae bacterium]